MSFIVRNITSGPPVAVELGDMGITIGIPAAEVTDVTTVADVAGSLGGTFFTLNDIVTKYYVWYDVDNGSADPAPAGRTSIEVDIATNDTANTVASNTQAAVDAVADFGASVSTNVVTITNATQGFVADARDGSAATGFTLNVTTQGDGTADFTLESPTEVARSTDLVDAIGATDLAVLDPLDGVTQLSAADSLIVVGVHNDPHFRSGPTFRDNNFRLEDDVDNTKDLIFQLSGITTATTRTITMADQNIDLTPGTGSYATEAEGNLAATALQDVVDDTAPQLGGNLDVNGNSIVSAAAGNIAITPDTTGNLVLDGLNWPQADGTANQVLTTDGAGQIAFQDTGDIAIFELEWRFSTSTVEADPGSGIFRYNNATLASVTAIFFDDETQNGIDVGALISALNPGDKLFIEQTNQSSRAVLFSVTGTPTDNTGFFTVPVSVDASGTLHQNNQRCAVLFLFTGDGDSTFTDDLFRIQDDGDNTRQIAFQASAITTATTRTITMADQDISLVPNTGSFLGDVIGDTTPQLGGNLDVNGNSIVSAAAGNIAITPDTTGSIVLDGINWPQADGTINQILETDGAGQLSFVTLSAGGPEFADNVFRIVDNVDATKKLAWEVTAITTATTRTWTVPDQNLDFTPDTGDFLANVIGDTTPQLGGNLDVNGNSIVSAAAGNIAITPDTTGNIVLDGLNWPQADGTVSQILRTDGAGQLSFQDQNLIVSFVIEDPTTLDAGLLQHKFGQAVTITRISASTDVGTVTIQFDERVEATPNTSGTDVMTAVLIADTNTEATTAFANANIAADAVLNLDIDAVATSPGVVRIHVEYRPQ